MTDETPNRVGRESKSPNMITLISADDVLLWWGNKEN
jgi:hypothetical protein